MKTSEMIAMLEKNPKLKFKSPIEDENVNVICSVDAVNHLIFEAEDNGDNCIIDIFENWEIIEEPDNE